MEMTIHQGAYRSADQRGPLLPRFQARDHYSALSHFIGFLASIGGTFPLLVRAAMVGCSLPQMLSLCAFLGGAIGLYGASTAYHTFQVGERHYLRLKRLDHAMIYLLIVGSYLPVCVFGLWEEGGKLLSAVVALIGAVGIAFTLLWVRCPKWLSSCIYIAMGWLSVAGLPQMLRNLSPAALFWLVLGGVLYTAGGVIYALRLPGLERRFPGFGAHELFHLFVLGGTACHYALALFCLVR